MNENSFCTEGVFHMAQHNEINPDGSFNRQKALFTAKFGSGKGNLPIEENRYRLIWAAPCPWSHRAVIARKILGLDSAISLGKVDPIRPKVDRIDWAFTLDKGAVDPVLGIQYLSEIYKKTDASYTGRPTVPTLVDVKMKKVVHNNYFILTNQLATDWAPFHREKAPNLYPENLQSEIDELNDIIYDEVNNGVYKCGFSKTQQAYEKAYDVLFARLEQLDERLANRRFLFGDFITDADIRLYVTLVRFDVAYYTVFNANKKRLIDFPHLWGYARDLYATEGFGDTTDFDAIKTHYYMSARLSPDALAEDVIIPKGPDLSGWHEDPKRAHLSKSKEKFLYD